MTKSNQQRLPSDRPGGSAAGGPRNRIWVMLGLVGILFLAGVLLPPVSLIERIQNYGYTALTANSPSQSQADGLVVSVDPAAADGTWLVQLGSVPRQDFLDGKAGDTWAKAKAALPATQSVKSPVFTIAQKGTPPKHVFFNLTIPNDAEPYNRLGVWAWDGSAWQWVPGKVDGKSLTVMSDLDFVPAALVLAQSTAGASPILGADLIAGQAPANTANYLSELVVTGLHLGASGAVEGDVVANNSGAGTLLAVRNYQDVTAPNTDDLFSLLGTPQLHVAQVTALIGKVTEGKYGGILLDYRGVDPTEREGFTDFVTLLARELHARSLRLTVVVESPALISGVWQDGGYDWRTIGQAADVVEAAMPLDPTAYGQNGKVAGMLDWAVHEVNPSKLQLGFTTLSLIQTGDRFVPVAYKDAVKPLGQVTQSGAQPSGGDTPPVVQAGGSITVSLATKATVPSFDDLAQTTTYTYVDDAGQSHNVWIGSGTLLYNRARFVGLLGLRGATAYGLLGADNATDVVAAFGKAGADAGALAQGALNIVWRVRDASGAVIMEATASFDHPGASVPMPLTPGAYVFDAQLPGGVVLGTAVVEVHAGPTITPTDTLTPTETPTSTPTPTWTPCPLTVCTATPTRTPTNTPQPTNTPEPTNTPGPTNTAAPPPVPPPSAGGFMSGVQINTNGDYGRTMPMARDLGVRYIKAQVRWAWMESSPGAIDWSGLDGVVGTASANGLGVLVSVLQAPSWNLSCGDAGCAPVDHQAAANFMGALAGRYCGSVVAIEVWNEMNLDREWGPTPDSGAYVDMLHRAYGAIKANCGSTVVISGALAPTGVEIPGGCCRDDFNYFQEMVNAGALNYMDCIGAHANANVIDTVLGSEYDPRGGHHSWTLKDTVWGYYNIGGGRRQICLTEFGIATGDGHGGVPPGFEWAASNSLQNQADWLVHGFTEVRGWGIFRMITIWNLDFYPSCGGCVDQNAPYSILNGGYGAFPAYSALQNTPK